MNPCGKSSHPDGISLYLRYIGGGSVTAAYTLVVELSDQSRLGTHTCSKRFERDTTWGSLNIVDRSVALERCVDDTLIVRLCNLHVINTAAITEPDNSATVWTIPEFSEWVRCSSSSANAVESVSFQMHGHVWSFKIRPCGRSDAPDDVSLFLVYNGAASFGAAFLNMLMLNNTTVAYTLRLQRTDGEVISEETQLNTFVVGQDLGSRHFANREEVLERTRFDDTVVVRLCNVRIVDTATTADKDGSTLWTIPRFGELVRCTKEDHHMQSDSFTMDGESWRFWIYPCGQSSAPDGISLFLQYTGTTTVTAVFTLQLQQLNGAIIDHVTYSHLFAPEDTWGSRPFSSRASVLEQIIAEDKLVIRVCNFRKVDRTTVRQGASVLWKIVHFSQLVRCAKTDLLVESDLFEMEGEQWRLMVKPCGATEASGDVAVYLRYLGAAASVTASYTLQLLKSQDDSPLATRTFAAHKFGPDTSWGTNTIADRMTILQDIKDDDTLLVSVVDMEIPDTQVGADEALEAAEQWFAEHRWRDAANAYTKALEAGHDKVQYVHQRKAFCYNEMGKHAEALKEWDAAVKAAPTCPFSRCKRGEQHLKLGRMKKAEKDALHALKLRPEYPEAIELLKNATKPALLLPERRSSDAKHSSTPSSNAQETFDHARTIEDSGQWTEAIAAYIRAINAGYPQPYSCHNRQGICFTKLGQHEEAFHQFDTAVSLAPEEATLYYNRGRQHLVLGRLKEAEADALKAMDLKPDHQLARKLQDDVRKRLAVPTEARDAFQNAKVLEEKGDWTAAIAAYQRAIDANYPQAFTCHNRQGICYAKLGLHDQAFRQFDTAVNLAPNDVASLRNRARKHQAFNRLREAEADAIRAVELKPDNSAGRKLLDEVRAQMAEVAEAAFQSAQNLRLRKQFHEAIDAYAKAIENGHPNLFTCYNNRSLCHTMLGQHQQALQDNIDCIKEDPTDPMGYDHRARTYMDLGKLELAEADAQMTLELDPDFDGADEFLESVRQQLKVPAPARSAFSEATTLYKDDERWMEAAEAFKRSIDEGHNEVARCHLYRGSCFEKVSRLDCAMKEYDLAVEKGMDDYRGWFTRGVTHRRQGKTKEATADCNRGMELAAASILSNPGLLDEILGPDVAKAIEELPDREQQRAVRPLAASMMAKTLFAMKIWQAAAAAYTLMFKPAGCIEPMGVKILPPPQIMHQGHHDRGVCFQNLGKHAEAFEDFNAAVKGQPTNSTAWFRRAQEQAALQKFHDAEGDLKHALALSPSEPGAKELLEVVRKKLKSKKVDAEMTQNLLLKELEEEEERAAKKKEKKKRQKQKKKQKAKLKEQSEENSVSSEPASESEPTPEPESEPEPAPEPELEIVSEPELQTEAQLEPVFSLTANAASPGSEKQKEIPVLANIEQRTAEHGLGTEKVDARQKLGAQKRTNAGVTVGTGTHKSDRHKTNGEPSSVGSSGKQNSFASDASNGPASKKGRPRTVQEAMTAGGFDRLKKTGGWQNDLCGPHPVQLVVDLISQRSASSQSGPGLRLGMLAEELKLAWSTSSVNAGALGHYIRYYDKCFDMESTQATGKGNQAAGKHFGPMSIILLKPDYQRTGVVLTRTNEDEVSEEHAVQQLVDHITRRSRDGKVTKMSALAGLFLNAKDKSILSRFGDLRPVLLKYNGTLKGFLEHHSSIFSIVEDPRIGDCIVQVWTKSDDGTDASTDTVRKEGQPKQLVLSGAQGRSVDERDCPLCCEPFDTTDMEFQSCECSYRVCVWCFHRIKDAGDGKCPSCRTCFQSGGVPLTEKQRIKLRQRRQQAAPGEAISLESKTPESSAVASKPQGSASTSGGSVDTPAKASAGPPSPSTEPMLPASKGRQMAREKVAVQKNGRAANITSAMASGSGTAASSNGSNGNISHTNGGGALSEEAVVRLLVDKINARSRDNKTTKASALAGGLFQSDGRYGDLRPVLLQYEGTIHGFLRHHKNIFLLEDPLGRPNSDDPIVRVRPPAFAQQPSSIVSGHAASQATTKHHTGSPTDRRTGPQTLLKPTSSGNPWKVGTKSEPARINNASTKQQTSEEHQEKMPPTPEHLRMRTASDMLPTAIFDDEDDLSLEPLSMGRTIATDDGSSSVPLVTPSFVTGVGLQSDSATRNTQQTNSAAGPSHFGSSIGRHHSSLFGGPLDGSSSTVSPHGWADSPGMSSSFAVEDQRNGAVRSSRWVSMTSDGTDELSTSSSAGVGSMDQVEGHAVSSSSNNNSSPHLSAMSGVGMPMSLGVGASRGGGGLRGIGGVEDASPADALSIGFTGVPANSAPARGAAPAWAPTAQPAGNTAFGQMQNIWGSASDIDSAFTATDPGAAFGGFGVGSLASAAVPAMRSPFGGDSSVATGHQGVWSGAETSPREMHRPLYAFDPTSNYDSLGAASQQPEMHDQQHAFSGTDMPGGGDSVSAQQSRFWPS
eukprot:SAG31_NODE_900_length_11140_cov_3.806086_1_plen_2434_part_00